MESACFRIATLQRLTDRQRKIAGKWVDLDNRALWERLAGQTGEFQLFREMGPDLNINTFAVNPILVDRSSGMEVLNTRPALANRFNKRVFRALSLEYEGDEWPPVVITGSTYETATAAAPIESLRTALGVDRDPVVPMDFLLATTMNPWMSDADGGTRNMVREVANVLKQAIEREVFAFRWELAGEECE
jgi:hypothetical protein